MTVNFIFKQVTEYKDRGNGTYYIKSEKSQNCNRYVASIDDAGNNLRSDLGINTYDSSCKLSDVIQIKHFSLAQEPQYSQKDGTVKIELEPDTTDKDALAFLYQSCYNKPGDLLNIWNSNNMISIADMNLI